ncbi:hypothetical protein SAMN05443637_106103 [Pseudonocardia thermophila]|jgi:hypothetical protein|uniref:Enoyl-(Acyl carrier protein) reductase n=1 Tax=Pseudonocardia thermophila TaxID=1848 RepID=A0A1M6SEJ1_PSETH|nr:hypothetical protein [Pseudonocardia thermophila]SHK43106.1 hypothetical protein SAMN05443637_106103 [Pseudonocardia thermophila]
MAVERAVLAEATMGPKARPDEIAAVVSWLGCAEGVHVNGAIVTAYGGWSSA